MEELVVAFDAVEKAAAAASSDGGAAAEDRCLDALKLLRRIPVSTKDLVATQNVILGSQILQLLASLAFLNVILGSQFLQLHGKQGGGLLQLSNIVVLGGRPEMD